VFEQTLGLASQRQESLVQLEQSIAPAFAPPKAVTKLLQRIAAKQVCQRGCDGRSFHSPRPVNHDHGSLGPQFPLSDD
jgi:hypothetical protein